MERLKILNPKIKNNYQKIRKINRWKWNLAGRFQGKGDRFRRFAENFFPPPRTTRQESAEKGNIFGWRRPIQAIWKKLLPFFLEPHPGSGENGKILGRRIPTQAIWRFFFLSPWTPVEVSGEKGNFFLQIAWIIQIFPFSRTPDQGSGGKGKCFLQIVWKGLFRQKCFLLSPDPWSGVQRKGEKLPPNRLNLYPSRWKRLTKFSRSPSDFSNFSVIAFHFWI